MAPMVPVYEFENPAVFIRGYVDALEASEKRGVLNRIARAAGIFPSYLSQVLKGQKYLNLEQASKIAEFLHFGASERRYFFRIVELARAQSPQLRGQIREEMNELKSKNKQVSSRINFEKSDLSSEDLEKLYSSWHFLAIRLMTAIPRFKDTRAIATHLGISQNECEKIIRFLLKTGLCKREGERLGVGPQHTHIDSKSPLVFQHHSNWRKKAMERHPFMKQDRELAYSAGLCLSGADAVKIREHLLGAIKKVREVSDPSPSERLFFLNVDWLEL